MPDRKWGIDINLDGNELQNAVLQNLGTAPANPKAGQIWYDTSTNLVYFYNGTSAKAVGHLPIATDSTLGGVKIGTNISVDANGVISVADASTSAKGLIEIATDAEVSTGTDTSRAVTPAQLATKLNKNDAITGATKTKITYDSKGLVTGGDVLSESDIPAIHLSKVTDVSATAAEVNKLAGLSTTATELGYVSGVTSSIQTQLNNKVTANTAITAGSGTKITYDTKGLVTSSSSLTASDIPDLSASYIAVSEKGANNGVASLDSTGKVPSSQLPSYVDDVVDTYIVSGASALTAGWLSLTDGGAALTPESGKIYVVLTAGTYLNKQYRWSGSTYVEISSSPVQATESVAGIAMVATAGEVAAGVIDNKFITPAKLSGLVAGTVHKFSTLNPALTVSSGVCTWNLTNDLGVVAVSVQVYEAATGELIEMDVTVTAATITIKMNSASNIAAETYRAVVVG